jgi:hypothetical protein
VVATDPSFREQPGGLLAGVPDFPTYPNAVLIGSAERNRPGQPNLGYRVKWTTPDAVATVVAWYAQALQQRGWTYRPPTDNAEAEQTARISKGDLKGQLSVGVEDGRTEIELVIGPR